VLVRVHAAGVDPGVWFFLTGKPYLVRAASGPRRPRRPILGRAVAGRVEAVGGAVTRWQPGDEVVAELSSGAYAEYVAAPASALARKPAGLTFAQTAALPISATTALQAMRDAGRAGPGKHVLVNGASGGMGTFAVQIAAALGAEVTAVCSTRNADLLRSIGADHVVDYAREDFTAGGPRYRLVPLVATPKAADLDALRDLVDEGKVAPVMDRTFDLADAAEALRHQGAGHARGKTVVTV
jgi:NADPH:quinone reductase-like Zn-dependent oxidoreductase